MTARQAFAAAGLDVSHLSDGQLEQVALDIVAEFGEDHLPTLAELRSVLVRYRAVEAEQPFVPSIPYRDIIAFEASTGFSRETKAIQVRRRFGVGMNVYTLNLLRAIDDPDCQAFAPDVVERLRAERDRRRELRVVRA